MSQDPGESPNVAFHVIRILAIIEYARNGCVYVIHGFPIQVSSGRSGGAFPASHPCGNKLNSQVLILRKQAKLREGTGMGGVQWHSCDLTQLHGMALVGHVRGSGLEEAEAVGTPTER